MNNLKLSVRLFQARISALGPDLVDGRLRRHVVPDFGQVQVQLNENEILLARDGTQCVEKVVWKRLYDQGSANIEYLGDSILNRMLGQVRSRFITALKNIWYFFNHTNLIALCDDAVR